MFHTYIIRSESNSKIYIGQTNNLEERLKRHNDGRSKYTKGKGPWRILYSFAFETRSEAVLLERKLKAFKNSKKVLLWAENRGRPDN